MALINKNNISLGFKEKLDKKDFSEETYPNEMDSTFFEEPALPPEWNW